jgi:putative NIF3 family GTP cyclohydrolase 1 type 2
MDISAEPKRLTRIVQFFDDFFRIETVPVDPEFSRFVPMVYDPIGFPWRDVFEPEFVERLNGLMLRGRGAVGKAWFVAFPSHEVLTPILAQAHPGDLNFSHHPIDMRCGDPRGKPGVGFIPIRAKTLQRLKERELSFYACHVPLDIHPETSTSDAIVRVIGGWVADRFLPCRDGYAGRLCDIAPTPLADLVATCRQALELPYLDLQGNSTKGTISRVAVITGGAGDVGFYREADRLEADCLVAGEVTSKIDNELGRRIQAEIAQYLLTTNLTAIGLSHAGSEFPVLQELALLVERMLGLPAEAVPEPHWWR